jgi:hypothetical protein
VRLRSCGRVTICVACSWIVLHVSEEEPKKFSVSGFGSGGVDEIVTVLKDDDIQYGAFRVSAIDRKGPRLR